MKVPEYEWDFWHGNEDDMVSCTFLLPNGITINLTINKNSTISEIKEDLFDEVPKYPLHGMLHDMSVYVFARINGMAEREPLWNESLRLCDIKPFCCLIMVLENKDERLDDIEMQISHLIGKGLHEFKDLKDREVNDFRLMMRLIGDEMAEERKKKTWMEKLMYQFPPRIAETTEIPKTLSTKFGNGPTIIINVILDTLKESSLGKSMFKFHVPHEITPSKLLTIILNKKATSLNFKGEFAKDYVLKVCGKDEYIVGGRPLIQFLYIQDCISADETPTLIPVPINNVPLTTDNIYENPRDLESKERKLTSSTLTLRKKGKSVSSWSLEDSFVVTINTIVGLNCDVNRPIEVGVQAGLFHGGKPLCNCHKSKDMVVKNGTVEVNETLVFDIQVCNIPRMARLCFVVYEVCKSPKSTKSRRLKDENREFYVNPLAWVNTTTYDYKSQLKTGAMTLYMWTYSDDIQSEYICHPLGTVVSNPDRFSAAITVFFENYGQEQTIMYPSIDKLLEYAEEATSASGTSGVVAYPNAHLSEERIMHLTHADTSNDMHEQDYKDIWSLRYFFLDNYPTLLPKILQCVEWNEKKYVAECVYILSKWPKLRVEKALELLDYAYADQAVRSFAVDCIASVSDEELSLYLLQLVQALKHECYLACDLVKFLLRRALNNQRIGHFLFWHLRSEMHMPSVSVRFGLILEAYCFGSPEHISTLKCQMECLLRLKECSQMVKERANKEKARACLSEHLEPISNVLNPLNPSLRCRRIKIEKCKIMDSKMRPLWIVLENADQNGDNIYVILKSGDDLRQDMLTLQMLRIMDRLWKHEGLDLRMNLYNCISLDHRIGLIEVVLNAETIANIQKERGMFCATAAFRRGSLLAWLKDHNQTEAELDKAIQQFTLSCAGYCVATYVLGVADRHSDNIMLKKNGQMFHIDFGHILGHFKEKFGFRRERVPFVLTHDFVHVINKGKRGEAHEFQAFQKHCERAFQILRKHGNFILSLFAMMISTGLPELSSEKDLNYLRDTLVLDLSEEEALQHFRSKFDEALSNSWKTSLNWASHNMAKNNKP